MSSGAGKPGPGPTGTTPGSSSGASPRIPFDSSPPERTCLHDEHRALGGTMVDFHGWEMPIRYGSIPDEHQKVRLSAGLFDLCHMGRLELAGKDAREWLQRVITNDFDAMRAGDARYTLICTEEGGIIDDAIVYKLEDAIFVVVNASNRRTVIDWMESRKGSLDATLIDRSKDLAMIAVQGPQASRILPPLVDSLERDWETLKYYSITRGKVLGKTAWIARTGYTGEDGFEVYLEAGDAPAFWRRILEAGGNRIAPIGLGARDTLRLEAGMPLYGNDIDLTTDPFEAGLGFAVKLEKAGDFAGKAALETKKKDGPRRKLTGLRVEGRRVARQGMPIVIRPVESPPPAPPEGGRHSPPPTSPGGGRATEGGKAAGAGPGEAVGRITSGAPSPTLGYPIAMGYLSASLGPEDLSRLAADIRGHQEPLSIASLPFYSRIRKKAK